MQPAKRYLTSTPREERLLAIRSEEWVRKRLESARIRLANGCLVWRRPMAASRKYAVMGTLAENGRGLYAMVHRLAYRLDRGPIPLHLELDHLCRNQACSNPEHLEAVSHRVNVLRGAGTSAINARRTHCIRGHEFSGENLGWDKGRRTCRACLRTKERERSRRRRAQLAKAQP
jgi:hypothetical protein